MKNTKVILLSFLLIFSFSLISTPSYVRECHAMPTHTRLLMDAEDSLNDIKKSFEELKDDLDAFSKRLKKVPESEEMKKLKQELERLHKEIVKSGEKTKEKIREEVIPHLKEEIEKLKKQLQKQMKKNEDGSDNAPIAI